MTDPHIPRNIEVLTSFSVVVDRLGVPWAVSSQADGVVNDLPATPQMIQQACRTLAATLQVEEIVNRVADALTPPPEPTTAERVQERLKNR